MSKKSQSHSLKKKKKKKLNRMKCTQWPTPTFVFSTFALLAVASSTFALLAVACLFPVSTFQSSEI